MIMGRRAAKTDALTENCASRQGVLPQWPNPHSRFLFVTGAVQSAVFCAVQANAARWLSSDRQPLIACPRVRTRCPRPNEPH